MASDKFERARAASIRKFKNVHLLATLGDKLTGSMIVLQSSTFLQAIINRISSCGFCREYVVCEGCPVRRQCNWVCDTAIFLHEEMASNDEKAMFALEVVKLLVGLEEPGYVAP